MAEHVLDKEHKPGQQEIQHFVQNTSRRRAHLSIFIFYKMKEFLFQLNCHALFKEGSL
jgi:hypothetical protein